MQCYNYKSAEPRGDELPVPGVSFVLSGPHPSTCDACVRSRAAGTCTCIARRIPQSKETLHVMKFQSSYTISLCIHNSHVHEFVAVCRIIRYNMCIYALRTHKYIYIYV